MIEYNRQEPPDVQEYYQCEICHEEKHMDNLRPPDYVEKRIICDDCYGKTPVCSIQDYRNMLEDVVNELDLSAAAVLEHGPLGTSPAELVRLVLDEKDKRISMLKNGLIEIEPHNNASTKTSLSAGGNVSENSKSTSASDGTGNNPAGL